MNFSFFKSGRPERHKFTVGSLIQLLIFGVVFTAAGLFFIFANSPDSDWVKTQGTVVSVQSRPGDSNTMYSAIVRYEVDGQSYTVVSSVSSSFSPDVGSSRTVAYNPDFPADAKVVEGLSSIWWLYIFPVLGILIIVISIISFIRSRKRTSHIDNLKVRGIAVKGVIVDLKQEGGSRNSPNHKVVVTATDNYGQVRNYLSDPIKNIGGFAFTDFRQNPVAVDVFIDPNNPENYYVDIADIPQLDTPGLMEIISKAVNSQQPEVSDYDLMNQQNNLSNQTPPQNTANPQNAQLPSNQLPFSPHDDETKPGWGAS